MMRSEHVYAMIKAHLAGDAERFRSMSLMAASHSRSQVFIRDVQRLFEAPVKCMKELPRSTKGGEELLDERSPMCVLDDLVLCRGVRDQLRGVIEEHALSDRLQEMGLLPSMRVIFDGPPGTGKTSAAGALAKELGWPFLVARHDSLVSSYLGETGSNLRKVFDFAAANRCVLLFDEFDSFGLKRRGGSQSVEGEMGRVLNLILQQMDRHRGPSILVAATNLPDALDAALNRRFDVAVKFAMPTEEHRRELIRRVLGEDDGPFQGSHAEIVRDATSERKRRILEQLRAPSGDSGRVREGREGMFPASSERELPHTSEA